jgi:hypothetical protein
LAPNEPAGAAWLAVAAVSPDVTGSDMWFVFFSWRSFRGAEERPCL